MKKLLLSILLATSYLQGNVFTVDFRKPEYKTSEPCNITHDTGTMFNPTCGKSWKLDRYDGEYSWMEIEFPLTKEKGKEYALEILACARKDPPELSNVTITVNGSPIVAGYHMYNGPDSIHYPNGSHMRWEVFQISNELHDGVNRIKISLDPETQSGISMSFVNVRPFIGS